MGVRLSQPELRPAAAQVHRRFPQWNASDTVRTGRDNRIRRSARRACASRCHSCVVGLRARLKTERFWFDSRGWHVSARGVHSLDASPLHCLMRTRPLGAALRCHRRSGGFESRRPLQRPRSTKVVQLPRKRLASVRFRPRALATLSSNGSGSEITNLRMVVRVHPESRCWAVIWDQIGFQVRSAGFDSSTACSAASSSPGGEIGFIRRACRVRSPGLLRRFARCGSTWLERAVRDRETGGSNPLTSTTRRAAHLGVIAVLQTACAGFDSLARYELVPLAQWKCSRPISERRRFESFTEHDRSWCA
jgi:hypothetical protein